MLVLMVFDHIYYYFGYPEELLFAHILARVVAPLFAYMTAQGMVYTRSRERYLLRLFGFSAVMGLGNMIVTRITGINVPNNIFLSLALGASLIYCVDKLKNGGRPLIYISFAISAILASSFCEGQYIVPMIVMIFYIFRDNKPLMYTAYVLASGVPFIWTYTLTGQLQPQIYMVFAVIPILLYNGRRGPDNAFAKYFFYAFYPLHVWIIVLARFIAQ